MPILNDIMDHEVLGREYKKGLQEGLQQGLHQGELTLVHRLIEKGFGSIPSAVDQRLSELSVKDLEELIVHVVDATSIDHLLK
jgi:hypothetical protein